MTNAAFNRKWFKDKYGIMVEPTASANVAADILEALMCRLDERDRAKMDLVEDVLNHCLFSFAAIIERHTTALREENERTKSNNAALLKAVRDNCWQEPGDLNPYCIFCFCDRDYDVHSPDCITNQ